MNKKGIPTTRSRYQGCLTGLAVGDALGAPVEFKERGSFDTVTEMQNGGAFNLPAGYWTDDTSMALCIAQSLIDKKKFDAVDQLERFLRWYREGYMSSTGFCFDIGHTTEASLLDFERTRQPYREHKATINASNGSLMRLAPIPMFFARSPEVLIERCGDSSRTTHPAAASVDACRYMGALISASLCGGLKEDVLSEPYTPYPGCWEQSPLVDEINEIANGSYKRRQLQQIRGDSSAAGCLEAALWAFYHSDNFKDGCIMAVNLGGDTDTTAAVFGQLAGAFYGYEAIPETWRTQLHQSDIILTYAIQLLKLCGTSA